ncbi:MAG TPA: potassium-transporting ATPase subunit F [Methylobacter sp.]
MNAEYLSALLGVMGLIVYLITALIIPEDFS